jgi:hypothetical protein
MKRLIALVFLLLLDQETAWIVTFILDLNAGRHHVLGSEALKANYRPIDTKRLRMRTRKMKRRNEGEY